MGASGLVSHSMGKMCSGSALLRFVMLDAASIEPVGVTVFVDVRDVTRECSGMVVCRSIQR